MYEHLQLMIATNQKLLDLLGDYELVGSGLGLTGSRQDLERVPEMVRKNVILKKRRKNNF